MQTYMGNPGLVAQLNDRVCSGQMNHVSPSVGYIAPALNKTSK